QHLRALHQSLREHVVRRTAGVLRVPGRLFERREPLFRHGDLGRDGAVSARGQQRHAADRDPARERRSRRLSVRASRVAVLLWIALFVIALVFTTLLALVGAIFIGVYLSHRLLSPTGFTPFEEEMLRMRSDMQSIKRDLADLRGRPAEEPTPDSASSPATEDKR